MLKALLIIIVLFLAVGYAIVLLRQLNSTAQQLGKLRQDLAKSDANLNDKLNTIQDKQAVQEALLGTDEPKTTNDTTSSTRSEKTARRT